MGVLMDGFAQHQRQEGGELLEHQGVSRFRRGSAGTISIFILGNTPSASSQASLSEQSETVASTSPVSLFHTSQSINRLSRLSQVQSSIYQSANGPSASFDLMSQTSGAYSMRRALVSAGMS